MNERCRLRAWAFALLALLHGCGGNSDARPGSERGPAAMEIRQVLAGGEAGDSNGHAQALLPRRFEFPADHGPHEAFRSEWWYFTGNLASNEGRRFGYHLTIFRNAIRPPESNGQTGSSAWRTRQVWMAHCAVVDVETGTVHAAERFARGGALGFAGAQAAPFRVWLDDWQVSAREGMEFAPLRLQAGAASTECPAGSMQLELTLEPAKSPVLQGDAGLSHKSSTPGNASYYYSISRLRAGGTLRLGDEVHAVHGTGWLDREWSTSALDRDQVGWDWFALQLDDDTELMFYRMRREDGSTDPASEGLWIFADGTTRRLGATAVTLTEERHWVSPRSGSRYPVGWRLRSPSGDFDFRVGARVDDQELNLSFRYWEGAVRVDGTRDGKPLSGVGYLEMTGYPGR